MSKKTDNSSDNFEKYKAERDKSLDMSTWALFDANVQTYRSNMIASESLLLAIAAIIMGQKDSIVPLILAVLALIILWWI